MNRRAIAVVLAVAGVVLVILGNAVAEGDSDPHSAAPPALPTDSPPPTYLEEPATSLDTAPPRADPDMGNPQVLEVPRLDIRAPVLPIEVEGGVLEPPSDASVVGWDVGTPRAGSAYGGTVITGHTVHTGGGALNELDDLRDGDQIYITTSRGRIEYLVHDVAAVTKQQMVSRLGDLYDGDRLGRLVLITCTNWNGVEYLANTVVIAEPA